MSSSLRSREKTYMEENVKGAAALGLKTILYKPDTDLESALRALGISF